jgi:hypothetical protein
MSLLQTSIDRGKQFFQRTRQRRWPRRTAISVATILVLYGIAGFIGVPYVLRRVLAGQVATAIHRAVTVDKIRFNPYRLRLEVDHLHVADRNPQRPFVDLGHLRVKVSWTSLFRLAPIIGEFYTDELAVQIVRTGEQTFNFSDLITSSPAPGPSKPLRFAISNIELNDGAIAFDDELLGEKHRVEHIRLALPFIANLPADVNVFAQPFLQMIVDGSRFHLNGQTKPFEQTQDTVLDLSLHRFDLTRYVAYVPAKLPIKLKSGVLSTVLHLHFINQDPRPRIRLDGGAALDAIDVRDQTGAPLLSVKHAVTTIDELEPLENIFHLKRFYIDGLNGHLARNADGTTNLSDLTESPAPAAPTPPRAATGVQANATPSSTITATPHPTMTAALSPSPTPQPFTAQAQLAAPAATATPSSVATPGGKASIDFALGAFELADSAVEVIDRSQTTPATVKLEALHAKLDNLRTVGGSVAPYELGANVAGGGTLTLKGNLELAKNQISTDAAIAQLDLPALKAFVAPYLNGDLVSGKLTASADVKTDLTPGKLNVHVELANATIDQLDLRATATSEHPIAWNHFTVALAAIDLAQRQAIVSQVRVDGLKVAVKRDRQGHTNLAALVRTAPTTVSKETAAAASPPTPRKRERVRKPTVVGATRESPPAATTTPQWRYQVASVVIDKAEIHAIDEHVPKAVKLDLAPLGISLKNISNDLSKPISMAVDGIVNGKGSLKIDGTAAPAPLEAKLHITTKRLDLTMINAYISDQLNATIAAAALTMNGVATATNHRGVLRAGYRGDLTLGSVRMLDKLTGDNFLRWNSLSASHLAADYGDGPPKVKIGGLALANFYSRIILRSDGKLNLKDIVTNPQEQPKSLTRTNPEAIGARPIPAPTPTPSPGPTPASANIQLAPSPKPLPAEIAIGGITLQGGHVNYTDNFIQPHYTADLTDIDGKIGAFGTGSTTPADVLLQGQVNGSAPLNIKGSLNPLTPLAFVDIAAKANGIELPGLSAYSTRYTGYPIVKGTLTVDVHYLLANQKLTANNHLFIDQLTFGDKVESKTAVNLPIRLAVALLKDSRGVIDLNIPVSGSLNDPQFSIGGVIWEVVKNLLLKAVTAPFSLITGAFNAVGGGGGGAELNYIEFDAGYAKLTPDSLKRLDTITRALTDRPALKLDIAGRVDPKVDTEGLRFAKVDHQVLLQKIKDVGESEKGGEVTVSPDEYDDYLKAVYKVAKFEKPRNLIGLAKSLPPEEMKKLLITNETVNDDDLHHLADARADAVRAALSRKIDPARLFIVPPKLSADDIKDQSKTTRADLSLE